MTPTRPFPRRFHDRAPAGFPRTRDMLRILREGGFSAGDPTPDEAKRVQRIAPPRRLPDADGRVAVTWTGHASTIIQVGGLTFLADPVWSERIPGGLKRFTPVGVPWESLPAIDAVLVSHNHYDHMDAPTLKRLPRDTPVIVPANLGRWFTGKGFTRVTELDWWERVDHEGVRVTLVPSRHWSRRGPLDRNATLWGGFVLQPAGGGGGVHFAGDSGFTPYWREIGERFPGLDVTVMPVGAYEPRWFMESAHQNPEEAVQAFLDVGARAMVPMHWGTFVLTREPFLEPLHRTRAAFDAAGIDRERLWDLPLGETRVVE